MEKIESTQQFTSIPADTDKQCHLLWKWSWWSNRVKRITIALKMNQNNTKTYNHLLEQLSKLSLPLQSARFSSDSPLHGSSKMTHVHPASTGRSLNAALHEHEDSKVMALCHQTFEILPYESLSYQALIELLVCVWSIGKSDCPWNLRRHKICRP